jgi:hypothetical protein
VELAKLAGRGRALRCAGSCQCFAAFGPRTVRLAGRGAGDRQPGVVQAAVASSNRAWPVAQEVVVHCHAFDGLQRRPAARFPAAHEGIPRAAYLRAAAARRSCARPGRALRRADGKSCWRRRCVRGRMRHVRRTTRVCALRRAESVGPPRQGESRATDRSTAPVARGPTP